MARPPALFCSWTLPGCSCKACSPRHEIRHSILEFTVVRNSVGHAHLQLGQDDLLSGGPLLITTTVQFGAQTRAIEEVFKKNATSTPPFFTPRRHHLLQFLQRWQPIFLLQQCDCFAIGMVTRSILRNKKRKAGRRKTEANMSKMEQVVLRGKALAQPFIADRSFKMD